MTHTKLSQQFPNVWTINGGGASSRDPSRVDGWDEPYGSYEARSQSEPSGQDADWDEVRARDARIEQEVRSVLRQHPEKQTIGVAVLAAEVTLSGIVSGESQSQAAEELARTVSQVRAVHNVIWVPQTTSAQMER